MLQRTQNVTFILLTGVKTTHNFSKDSKCLKGLKMFQRTQNVSKDSNVSFIHLTGIKTTQNGIFVLYSYYQACRYYQKVFQQ